MLKLYRRQIYRDRRRIAFAVMLTLAAGHFGNGLLPDPLPVATELLLTLAFLALIPVLAAKLRAKRHWVEIIAIGNLIVTLTGSFFPSGVFGWHGPAFMLTLQFPAFLAVLLGLKQLIYGHWSDSFLARHRFVVETTLRTRLPLDELWYGMVPTPGFADRNPDCEVVSIEFADATKKTVRLTTWVPPRAGTGEVLLHLDEVRMLEYARFRLRIVKGTHDPDAEGETEFSFEDRGNHRILRLRHRVTGYTLRRAVLGYFDDTFGRLMTARLNAIETRVATGRPTKAKTSVNSWFQDHGALTASSDTAPDGYQTVYGRKPSPEELRVLQALGRI